jgi:excisionase family DNA binding protein
MATKEQFAYALRQQLGLYTPEELAVMLNVSDHTVLEWRKFNTGPAFTRLGKRVYYRKRDIEEWIEKNVLRPKDPQP